MGKALFITSEVALALSILYFSILFGLRAYSHIFLGFTIPTVAGYSIMMLLIPLKATGIMIG